MKYFTWLIANAIWFGFFMYMIIYHNWTPWSLVVPVMFHWNIEDIK